MTFLEKYRQTDGRPKRPMELTTITYYKVSGVASKLAVVRYTAYNPDGLPEAICEDSYQDTPEDFCRLEADIETALNGGIDTSIMSAYEADFSPVILRYLAI